MRDRLRFSLLGLSMAAMLAVPAGAQQRDPTINVGPDSVAIKGYDAVAYFTEGKPTKGASEFTFSWQGAQWRFANARHRELFSTDPTRYAPQFGGFCSMALTRGTTLAADPEAWAVVDGKLYLSVSKQGIQEFKQNPAEHAKKAEAAWAEKQRQK